MSRVPGNSNAWQAAISAPTGTIFRYYFARNNDYGKLESYAPFWPNGYSIGPGLYQHQPPLRELLVTNGAAISETAAAWADTAPLSGSTGTITGTITDKAGNPLTGLWISAGPHQTFSDASGNFLMQGVPAGPCTITVRSENGEYAAVSVSVNIVGDRSVRATQLEAETRQISQICAIAGRPDLEFVFLAQTGGAKVSTGNSRNWRPNSLPTAPVQVHQVFL